MDVQYDEDISRNRFYRKLQADHQIFLDTALIEGWIICVPRNGSINEKCLADQEFLLAQILVPNDELSETHFTNLNCADIRLNEGRLITGGITARILFEELFYSKDGLKYKIWCLERPLCDTVPYGIVLDDEFSRFIAINKLQDAVDFIRIAVKPRYVFSKIDAAVQNFIKTHQVLTNWNLKQYKGDVRKLHTQCLEILLLNRKFKEKCRNDAHLKQNVEIAVETYMMDKLYDHTKDVINICQLEQVESFNKTLRNLSDIHISELSMKRTYADVIPTVKKELLRIDDFRTPIEKMNCLKRAFEIIAKEQTDVRGRNANEQKVATTDDVIPLLIFVIIKTGLTNWIMNLIFLKEFQMNNTNTTTPKEKFGQNTYLITTLEAVIVYISCCSIERSQRLGIDIVPSEDTQIQSCPEMKFRNADQFLNYLFTLMKNHEEERIFNIFQDFNNKNEPQGGSKYKKCHPLCSCNKCDMLPYQPHIDDRNQNGLAAIHLAATLGSPKLLTLILNLKPNVDAVDAKNWTALHYAAANGHQNLLLLLLHAGININSTSNDQHTSLHLACLNGHSGCVKALLYFSEHMKIHIDVDAQTQMGQTSLHYASKWGFSDIVETLLEYSATVKIVNRAGATPLKYAHNLKIAKLLQDAYQAQLKRRKTSNPYPVMSEEFVVITNEDLHSDETFLEYRNIEEMKRLEKAVLAIAAHDTKLACFYLGLDIFPPTPLINTFPNDSLSEKDCHPLCTCPRCLNDSADFYTLLRKPYASKTNALTKVNLNATNGEGYTALHVAAMCGNIDMINILLDHHVNILARTKSGATALHLACRERRLNVIKLLLNLCPSEKIIDLKDCRGDTPLHYAVEQNQLRIVEILLCAKADRSLRNLSGHRPIDIARTRLFFNVMNILERKH
ncbi:ankyrin repeat domain-containing protein 27-like [Toxorhynchites rutilus septentrionalis]|uniref:ankyrin repeat domain-containing protein 27-like n=1 Tax=Toxorhynchites rutilus septentrionalis TaxID=329112 RepID=UPI0024789B21|nr:ankyrin repeat domain-containing protein 27-like [Toxorhynchites rutilus septentrionalis]XP_055642052.1 ankyrin repeat domain-containing protein 27-like [Toxorhynchites rutilus septentrionalis]XP_055642053.1 ankyrin repeat domain-containing protein 27-like [Toxorhynchites rutilus septentrionalis]